VDHKWNQDFIDFAKETVVDIFNTKYRPPEHLEVDNSNDMNNGFFNHLFKNRQKVQQCEVDSYLKASRAEPTQDILLWWKVYFISNYY
jgi:hypothetical protein